MNNKKMSKKRRNELVREAKESFEKGKSANESDDYDEAVKFFDKAIDNYEEVLNSGDDSVKLNLAECYFWCGNVHQDKLYSYDDKNNNDDDDEKLKLVEKVFKDYKKAVKLNPNMKKNYEFRHELANTYRKTGQLLAYKGKCIKGAMKCYKKAIEYYDMITIYYCIEQQNKLTSSQLQDFYERARANRGFTYYLMGFDEIDESKYKEVAEDLSYLFGRVVTHKDSKHYEHDFNYIQNTYNDNKLKNNIDLKPILQNIFVILALLRVRNSNVTKYTSKSTFDNIFKKDRVLRILNMNTVASMNDANEGKVLLKFLKTDKSFYKLLIDNEYLENHEHNLFVSSFTENRDDTIGMWNSQYGDVCKGMSYRLDINTHLLKTEKIEDMKGTIQYCRVIYYNGQAKQDDAKFLVFKYDEQTNTVALQKELSKVISKLFLDILDKISKKITGNVAKKTVKFLDSSLIVLRHLVKDVAYYHENEVRLIVLDPKTDVAHYDNNVVYYKTGIELKPTSVRLSPYLTRNPKYLKYYEYLFNDSEPKVDVKNSDHPYNFDDEYKQK